jgi:IPT/TIG domain
MKIVNTTILVGLLVVGLACGYSKSVTPPSPGTVPTISQLSPPNATAGGGSFTLTVDGTNFIGNATINWNGTTQTTTPVAAGTQLMTTIPASAIAASGTASVTVTNPGKPGGIYGGGTQPETSNSMAFAIN